MDSSFEEFTQCKTHVCKLYVLSLLSIQLLSVPALKKTAFSFIGFPIDQTLPSSGFKAWPDVY